MNFAPAEKPAIIVAKNGQRISHGELDKRSDVLARTLARLGLKRGDHVALLFENTPAMYEATWACQRSGLYYTPINWHLTPPEAAYIANDCGAKVLIASATLSTLAQQIAERGSPGLIKLSTPDAIPGFDALTAACAATPMDTPYASYEGHAMMYSSGTTGRPKGVKRKLAEAEFPTLADYAASFGPMFNFNKNMVFLLTGPLYHSAPLAWSMTAQRYGGTVVLMERFDAEEALRLIDTHKVTHGFFVPTMFVRMLKLPDETRKKYDLSSLTMVVHAAAPCPVEVKRSMIDWLGPVIYEFYAGSEGNGLTMITPKEWLAHPGTVGRPEPGTVHILDEEGNELPTGEVGLIYFSGGTAFEYHNDPEKTRGVFTKNGWSTLGDLGYLDEQGYLFLSDRRTDLIIAGGVNIYPREIEDAIITHESVADVAVIGVPDEDMGQRVIAIVEPAAGVRADAALAETLIAHCRERIAKFKCPKAIEFQDALPRTAAGKILRRVLRDQYAEKSKRA